MTFDNESLQFLDGFLARRASWTPEERAAYAETHANMIAIQKRSAERDAELAREHKRREIQRAIDRIEKDKQAAVARAESERAALASQLAEFEGNPAA